MRPEARQSTFGFDTQLNSWQERAMELLRGIAS